MTFEICHSIVICALTFVIDLTLVSSARGGSAFFAKGESAYGGGGGYSRVKRGDMHILHNEPLSRHTTFRIGGPADIYAEPDGLEELRGLVRDSEHFFIIGGGSNLLVNDAGFRGTVISLNAGAFKRISFDGSTVRCGSGVRISDLLNSLQEEELSGLEFMRGIPATVGGAVVGNAGISKEDGGRLNIGDRVSSVVVLQRDGGIKRFNKMECGFSYRSSLIKGEVLLEVEFQLKRGIRKEIEALMDSYFALKRSRQELTRPSAGCIFKNPDPLTTRPAARLIEEAGLKGKRIGDAEVSERHANFIVNTASACAKDVLELIGLIQRTVKARSGIGLEREIEVVS